MRWQPSPEELAEEREFRRLYGQWDALDPAGVASFLADYPGEWWLVGGWAIDAFIGEARHHEDVDVMIWRRDLPLLRALVGERHHMWCAGSGMLRPLNDDFPEPHPDTGQVWLRDDAASPWFLDCLLAEDRDGLWVSRRDPEHVAPLSQVTWLAEDGIRYQRPEVVLHHKALQGRPKDLADLERTWPLLDPGRQAWLRDAVRRLNAEHPWLDVL